MIRMMNNDLFLALGLDFDKLFHLLARISECPYVAAEYRARAMAMRVVRTFGWESGQALDCWMTSDQGPITGTTLKLKLMEEIETAVHLESTYCTKHTAFVYFTLALAQRAFKSAFESTYGAGLNAWKGSHHEDLLCNLVFTYLTVRVAVERGIRPMIRAMIRMIDNFKLIGEWGSMFSEWWRTLEDNFAHREVYRAEWATLHNKSWESDVGIFTDGNK